MEVYSNIHKYSQLIGKYLIAIPIPHKSGHTLIGFQLQNEKAIDNIT